MMSSGVNYDKLSILPLPRFGRIGKLAYSQKT